MCTQYITQQFWLSSLFSQRQALKTKNNTPDIYCKFERSSSYSNNEYCYIQWGYKPTLGYFTYSVHTHTTDIYTELFTGHSPGQCSSTGVLRNLRVPPMASKGSTELNQETGTKRHLWPLDVFSGLLVHPKCTCSRGSIPNLPGGAYSVPQTL